MNNKKHNHSERIQKVSPNYKHGKNKQDNGQGNPTRSLR